MLTDHPQVVVFFTHIPEVRPAFCQGRIQVQWRRGRGLRERFFRCHPHQTARRPSVGPLSHPSLSSSSSSASESHRNPKYLKKNIFLSILDLVFKKNETMYELIQTIKHIKALANRYDKIAFKSIKTELSLIK